MPSLKGSEIGPVTLDSSIHRTDIRKSGKKVQIEAIERILADWEAVKKTSNYSVMSELADPKIAYFKGEICKGVLCKGEICKGETCKGEICKGEHWGVSARSGGRWAAPSPRRCR